MLQERLTTSEVFCDEQHVDIKVNYTSLSPWTSLGTIGSVSDGSFLSIAAPRRQALKYFFWTWAEEKMSFYSVHNNIQHFKAKKPHFYLQNYSKQKCFPRTFYRVVTSLIYRGYLICRQMDTLGTTN